VGIAPRAATVDDVMAGLTEDGYALVEDLLTPEEVARTRADLTRVLAETPTGRNDFEGHKTRRIYALFAKTRAFDGPATHPLLLGVLDRVLGHYQLSAPTGIEIGPGEVAQVLHHDDSIYPLPVPHGEVVLNTMWPFDDFTEENGATRIIPGSHKWEPGRRPAPGAETICAEMEAGSVLFYTGSVFHGGGANHTDRPRLGVILEYCAGWIRAQENHVIGVPRDVAATLPARLQELLGYNVYPPFLGNVDGRHPRKYLAD
jgi:ectoine hydroxylase-related dioxygenase (phytanoyl-CoA dioxygenase family)